MNVNQYFATAARQHARADHALAIAKGYQPVGKSGFLHASWLVRAAECRTAAVCAEIMGMVLIDPGNTQADPATEYALIAA